MMLRKVLGFWINLVCRKNNCIHFCKSAGNKKVPGRCRSIASIRLETIIEMLTILGHVAVYWQEKMYIYGGIDAEGLVCNDMFALDEKFHWQKVDIILPALAHASACIVGNIMYVSGGLNDKKEATKEMIAIDMSSMQVSVCTSTFEPRYGHAMLVSPKNTLIIVGGILNGTTYAQILEYQYQKEWNLIAVPDDFEWNMFQRACFVGDTLYSFGGRPCASVLGKEKILVPFVALPDDLLLHILSFSSKCDLNSKIAANKKHRMCVMAARKLHFLHITFYKTTHYGKIMF